VAQAEIVIADEHLLPQVTEVYNLCFRPRAATELFTRRFQSRHNVLTLLARVDERPVGFWVGFELKPGVFYHWLGAVIPEARRTGIASQLQDAMESWAREQDYEYLRCECLNAQKEFIHFAVSTGYTIVGIRWDSTRSDNLIIFEKSVELEHH
jgi:GNAT superfamily N-acetyltransferase